MKVSTQYGIIDDNHNIILMHRDYCCRNDISSQSEVLLQFIKAGYNVKENMVPNFKWMGFAWDYVQLITDEHNVKGLRLYKRSSYLNAYYIVANAVKDDSLLENHFYYESSSFIEHPLKNEFKFDVHYNQKGSQYNIVVDIISFYEHYYSSYALYEKNRELLIEYQRKPFT